MEAACCRMSPNASRSPSAADAVAFQDSFPFSSKHCQCSYLVAHSGLIGRSAGILKLKILLEKNENRTYMNEQKNDGEKQSTSGWHSVYATIVNPIITLTISDLEHLKE